MLSTRDPPQNKRPTHTKSEGIKKIQANGYEKKKKLGQQILMLNKIDFKRKVIARNKEGH